MSAPSPPAMSAPALPLQLSVEEISACWHQRMKTCREHLKRISKSESLDARQLTTHIHEARKELKGLRALSRLLRDAVDEQRYQFLNTAFRDAARELSDLRRQAALHECLATLRDAGQLSPESFERLSSWVDPIPARQPSTREQVDRALEILLSIPTDPPGAPSANVGAQLLRQFHRAKKSYLCVEGIAPQTPDALLRPTALVCTGSLSGPADLPEALHEWRKQVKHHTLQMRAACPASRRLPLLKQLGSSLGDAHDLDDLRRHVQQQRAFGEGAIWKHRILALVARRELELTFNALALGARLFTRKSTSGFVSPPSQPQES